jgi:AcrR family transcriptional regulator
MTATDTLETRRHIRPAKENAIFDATIALLSEIGYDRTTMDGIAARAGVGKATLYRWWPGKPELVVAAVGRRSNLSRRPPDLGSLRADLQAVAHDLIRLTQTEGAILIAVASASFFDNPELAAAVRHYLVPTEQALVAGIVTQAQQRGEITSAVPTLAFEIMASMIFGRFLLTGGALDDAFVEQLVDQVLLPVMASTPPGTAKATPA